MITTSTSPSSNLNTIVQKQPDGDDGSGFSEIIFAWKVPTGIHAGTMPGALGAIRAAKMKTEEEKREKETAAQAAHEKKSGEKKKRRTALTKLVAARSLGVDKKVRASDSADDLPEQKFVRVAPDDSLQGGHLAVRRLAEVRTALAFMKSSQSAIGKGRKTTIDINAAISTETKDNVTEHEDKQAVAAVAPNIGKKFSLDSKVKCIANLMHQRSSQGAQGDSECQNQSKWGKVRSLVNTFRFGDNHSTLLAEMLQSEGTAKFRKPERGRKFSAKDQILHRQYSSSWTTLAVIAFHNNSKQGDCEAMLQKIR